MLCFVTSSQLKESKEREVIQKKGVPGWKDELRVPPIDEAGMFSPYMYDFALARSKGLVEDNDVLTDKYLKMQAVYKAAFYSYLDNIVNFKLYEETLDETGYVFVTREGNRRSSYHHFGSYDARFIFLRNNFYIERLSKDEIELLNAAPDAESLYDLVERTYKDIIAVRNLKYPENKFDAEYDKGALTGVTKAPNNALVLGLAYGREYDAAGMLVSKENEEKKWVIANRLARDMEERIAELLGIPVVVFVYG